MIKIAGKWVDKGADKIYTKVWNIWKVEQKWSEKKIFAV